MNPLISFIKIFLDSSPVQHWEVWLYIMITVVYFDDELFGTTFAAPVEGGKNQAFVW